MNRITIDDISYDDVIFTIWIGKKECIPVELAVYRNNKYKLFNEYESCMPNQNCNSILKYTSSKEGKYDYDIIQIIKHSTDANHQQFTNDNLSKYEIYGGNGYMFITDDDNKYLTDFLKSINVDLNQCASLNYFR